jgi:hypothetical protein
MRIPKSATVGGESIPQLAVSVAAAALLAISATTGLAQQACPSESQFLMAISKQGLASERFHMVKGAEADRLVEETVAIAGDFVPPYDYVLVVERDDYTSVNPVRGGAMCLHWRLTPHDWRRVKEIVFGKIA